MSPGGGDSLQAAKKGIMEIADLIVVNKADGYSDAISVLFFFLKNNIYNVEINYSTLLGSAKHTAADYSGSLQFLRQKHSGSKWKPQVDRICDYYILCFILFIGK